MRPQSLPIYSKQEEIIRTIKEKQVTVIAGATGSGKTTQLPKLCRKAGRGKQGIIGITQPRRIAATSIAQRIAEESNTVLGSLAGYKIRFHEQLSQHTKIVVMTDGILLTEIQWDPYLSRYDTLIIDEVHERSLNIDFLMGYLKKILPQRPDLKIILSSATIDTALFSKAFDNAPVIEVSGRMYPVDVWYHPINEQSGTSGSYTYVDGALDAIEELCTLEEQGDILVFMPSEQDIVETVNRAKKLHLNDSLVLPLYARLSRGHQNAIFQSTHKRKIVVATNIAETSLTVPGIRFVVDCGLARVKYYVPRLRTNRLPIEEISRASADQRKGRCGRVSHGLCIRLYSEEDYLSRKEYTTAEIKRSNLAGVILQMLSLKLGEIETFSFIEPPSEKAIKDGIAQLSELGAISEDNKLTALGIRMAQLPLDPHISRMVLQAQKENAIREVIVIAAGLSIGDPRERPAEKQMEADSKHKRFIEPTSDFLTLLNLWEQYHGHMSRLKTQNKMRQFCTQHFLSYYRMREWHDIYQQILMVLKQNKKIHFNKEIAPPENIHRSILSGLISNIAAKKEKGGYSATRNKEVYIFPGSVLFKKSPDWIMCHEIVETAKPYARTVAPIDPQWVEEIAPSLCKYQYSEPFFDPVDNVVKVFESVYVMGLAIVRQRTVLYRRINPEDANTVFIQEALVNQRLSVKKAFLRHNKEIIEHIESFTAKLRNTEAFVDEDELLNFYKKRIPDAASIHDLNKSIKQHGSDHFLYLDKNDIVRNEIPDSAYSFPDSFEIGGKKFPLSYTFHPGSENDGVTLTMSEEDALYIDSSLFSWIIPAFWPEKIHFLLKNLPLHLRKRFTPLADHAYLLARNLKFSTITFSEALALEIQKQYNLLIEEPLLQENKLPHYLTMRLEIVSKNGNVVWHGRNVADFDRFCAKRKKEGEKSDYHIVFSTFEKKNITEWNFGDLDETIEVKSDQNGFPIFGYPALKSNTYDVDIVVLPSKSDAEKAHRAGVSKLCRILLKDDIAWLEKDLNFPHKLRLLCSVLGGAAKVKEDLFHVILRDLLFIHDPVPRKHEEFDTCIRTIQNELKGLGFKIVTTLQSALDLYHENTTLIEKMAKRHDTLIYGKLKEELTAELQWYISLIQNRLVFYNQLVQYPRYLKAFSFRIERAFTDIRKYKNQKERSISFCDQARKMLSHRLEMCSRKRTLADEFILMVEEFIISLSAQQNVKTLYPVSEKRLIKKLQEINDYKE